ncbi:hypothetical protein ACOMHN_018373 [Nucella lapillus]
MADAAKKKLTKAEKEKLKKEEQEKKELEEEEERARLAEEEKRKKKEEKLLAVERQKLENEERKQRRLDMTELTDMLSNNKQTLQARDDARRREAKWARYMRCDGSPDPTNQGEINTYINLKLENHERDDIESVLKDAQLDLALIAEVEFLLNDTPLEDLPLHERQGCRETIGETIGELQHVIQLKLDAASLHVLCDASRLQDAETSNLQYVQRNNSIALCTWGNLSKNPRIKSFEFTECGFGFDIPRILTLSGCAMRFLHMKFDHFSPYSKAYYPRRKKEEEVVAEPEAAAEDAPAQAEGAEEEKDKVEGEVEPENPDKEDTMDLMSALLGHKEEKEEEHKPPEEEEEVVEEDFEDPSTPEPQEWEDFDEEDDIVDLRAYHVVGGVFTFDLLNLPPQPKVCKNWTITQMVEPPKMTHMEYVADAPVASGQEKQKDVKDQEKDKRDEKPPINITMNLPPDVMFLEEPQVARWDASKQYWRTDGFSNFAFDEESRTLKFSLIQFGTMCLLQDTHINMPFQSWELRPHNINAAVFTIIAAIVELEIEIKDGLCCLSQHVKDPVIHDGLCCLSQPAERFELHHVLNQWMTPRELVENLRKAGVNVFPQEDSSKYVTVQNKNPVVVDRLYDQMGLVASVMAFSWSKWNSEVASDTIVLQGAEALSDEPLLEEDWSLFKASKRRFVRLKMTEFDEEFNEEMADGIQFKSNLYHYARDIMSEPAKERLHETSNEFIDCVQQLLKATQVLTFA